MEEHRYVSINTVVLLLSFVLPQITELPSNP